MKILPIGPSVAIACASWPAPLGITRDDSPRPFAASPMIVRIFGSLGAATLT